MRAEELRMLSSSLASHLAEKVEEREGDVESSVFRAGGGVKKRSPRLDIH